MSRPEMKDKTELTDGKITWKFRESAFRDRVVDNGPDECWGWTGGMHRQGYGMFGVRKTGDSSKTGPVNAKRLAMALKLGRPLKHSEFIRSTCSSPDCCNPKHMVLVKSILPEPQDRDEFFTAHLAKFSGRSIKVLEDTFGITSKEARYLKTAFTLWVKR